MIRMLPASTHKIVGGTRPTTTPGKQLSRPLQAALLSEVAARTGPEGLLSRDRGTAGYGRAAWAADDTASSLVANPTNKLPMLQKGLFAAYAQREPPPTENPAGMHRAGYFMPTHACLF